MSTVSFFLTDLNYKKRKDIIIVTRTERDIRPRRNVTKLWTKCQKADLKTNTKGN